MRYTGPPADIFRHPVSNGDGTVQWKSFENYWNGPEGELIFEPIDIGPYNFDAAQYRSHWNASSADRSELVVSIVTSRAMAVRRAIPSCPPEAK